MNKANKNDDDYFYQAFISYSRKDRAFAQAVQNALEKKYRILKKEFQKVKTFRIARDEEDFTPGSDLGEHISQKLRESKHLILICSKNSRESPWVNKEVHEFINLLKATNSEERKIIPVIIDGDSPVDQDIFPKALIEHGYNPLSIDFRPGAYKKGEADIYHYLKQQGTNKLFAALLDINYSIFINRQEKYEKNRRKKIIAFAVTLFIGVVIALYLVKMYSLNPSLELESATTNLTSRNDTIFMRDLPANFSNELVACKNGAVIRSNDDGSIFIIRDTVVDTVKVSEGLITGLCLWDKEKFLVVCSVGSNKVILHNIKSGVNQVLDTTASDGHFFTLDVSEKRKEIAYGSSDGVIIVYNGQTGKRNIIKPLVANSERVEVVKFSDFDNALLIAYKNGIIIHYNLQDGSFRQIFKESELVLIYNLCETRNGTLLAACEGKSACINKIIYHDNKRNKTVLLDSSESVFEGIFNTSNENVYLVSDWNAGLYLFDLDKMHKVWFQRVPTQLGESGMISVCTTPEKKHVLVQTQSRQFTYKIKGLSVFE